MSVEAYSFKGKTIYIVSENDLAHHKKAGRSIRATCPVHNSRDLDASIAPYSPGMNDDDAWLAGWGHCHGASCNADFLVKEWNPRKARYITQKPIEISEPKIQLTAKELEKVEDWQRLELASLNKIHNAMCSRLQHPRAQAYIAQRGIAHMMDLLTQLEVGYIPPENEWNPPLRLRKWCDRLVFPYTTAEGERGYVARTLRLWTPGMDENEHKKVLDEHNKQLEEQHAGETYKYQIRRWEKTYRSGFFNMQAAHEHRHIFLMEGTFDMLPALYEGLSNVVAVAGTHFDVNAIPKTVLEITLAYDAGSQGQDAARKTKNIFEKLGREGIRHNILCAPEDDQGKDWSERYRLHGRKGIEPLFSPESQTQERCPVCHIRPGDHEDIEFYSDEQGNLYCQSHWTGPLPDTQMRLSDGRIVLIAAPMAPKPVLAHENVAPAQDEPTCHPVVKEVEKVFGPCEAHMVPPSYTKDRVRELAEEKNEKYERLGMIECSSPDEFFERLERGRLKNFIANVPSKFLERAKRPRTYPAPFPEYGLVVNPETGKEELKQVGIHNATIEAPAISA